MVGLTFCRKLGARGLPGGATEVGTEALTDSMAPKLCDCRQVT